MRCSLVILSLLLPATAVAESDLDGYVRSARTMARRGDCAAVAAVSAHVRRLSPAFHAETFSRDPVIATCDGSRAIPPRSPDLPAPVDAPSLPGPAVLPERIPGLAAPLEHKSGATAISLSLGATLGGVAALAVAANARTDHTFKTGLAITGLGLVLIGPTAGHIYAGNAWNRGLQVRLGSLAVATAGIALAWRACAPFQGGCSEAEHDQSDLFGGVGFVGTLVYSVAMFYEIGSAGSAAHKYNVRLVPTGNGVGAVGRF